MKRGGHVALAVAVVAMLFGLSTLRARSMEHYLATQTYEDIYYLPPPAWLKVMSLGHREALADLIWMRALIYFGDEFANAGTVRHVFRYGRSLIGLDPDFRRAYKWVGLAGLYTPKGSSTEFMEQAIEVLKEGADRFRDDGDLAWDAGASIAYDLVPHLGEDDPRREALQLQANEYMMTAARLGAAPDWLVLTNASQLRKLGQADRALRHLEEMYATVRDPNIKQQIGIQLQVMRNQAYAEAFQDVNREFDARHQAELPYLPESLYFFIADPITASADASE